MSTTFKMVSGDLYINESTGKPRMFEGPGKMAQDLIEELLTEYNPKTNRGTKIRQLTNTGLIQQEIAETVDRLKERQSQNPALSPREQINTITRLVVQTYDSVNVMFYLEVESVTKDKEQITLLQNEGKDIVPVDQQLL